jgi:NitT/TauT family transport system ATP-binding protein
MFIEISGLGKRYPGRGGPPVPALSGIDLQIGEGEFLCIVGPSGCGKSTLLKVVAGLIPAYEGTISIAGSPAKGPRRDIGVVFQAPLLLPWRTVLENVLLPIELQNLDRKAYTERARHLVQLVGLSDFESRYPGELSGGMQQRVGICRALVHDPKVLLMDEPFGALDAMNRELMNVELLRIWSSNRKTALFVTHSIVEAVFLADRIVVMSSRPGQIRDIMRIDLPRPRLPEVMATEQFGAYAHQVRQHFDLRSGVEL